ncbi:hypothetical protein N7495_003933 [Penicillium taxi]|uniref:uncharacterized protein n=1 Tax=Penicillium taxi TaxID=168475 RepID=UPI002545B973|nr:uncharacterized protein N7495_003933 [Penicillium taxi]KAJ5899189.1 hypothetical protein N7495_003933 [Penicillium taxi]
MLLNLGLTADAAAAHTTDLSVQLETPPTTPSYYSAFSFPKLPFVGNLYNKSHQLDGHTPRPASITAMSALALPSGANSTQTVRIGRSNTTRKSTRRKTSYQLAHPASHARHKRLKLRPKLLLQLQQTSQTPRPLPILDILPSTLYLPRLARKFPTMFRGKNGLGPNDLIIVLSDLYERTAVNIPKNPSSEDEDEDQREVVATICQMLQDDARMQGKAEICMNFGPVWEATPLPSGSYEFVAHIGNDVKVLRWALRGAKSRRLSAPTGAVLREDTKKFTFSVLDPTTRRHPVIATMTRNQLEVFDEYSTSVRSDLATPSSGMSVVSDLSDADAPLDPRENVVPLEDGLRTLIIVTSIWVAFREGWSDIFSYDPVSSIAKSPVQLASQSGSPVAAKNEVRSVDQDDCSPRDLTNRAKRCVSVSSVHRAVATPSADKSFGSLSKRSNSSGAAFMERAKQRSTSTGARLNRHTMVSGPADNGHIVVSRPPSLRQNSTGPEEISQPIHNRSRSSTKTQFIVPDTSKFKVDRASTPPSHHSQARTAEEPKTPEDRPEPAKGKRRHRLSSFFHIFHRKHEVH